MRHLTMWLCVLVLSVGCASENGTDEAATAGPIAAEEAAPSLGLRPDGDTEIAPDMTQVSDELGEIFQYIDDHFEEDVRAFQRWIQQPSISNTGEGIPESAQMVRGFFDELGCTETFVYEPGETRWGAQGNPVVYANCDEGKDRTVLMYWMYDNMPITQPDLWTYPPFEGRLVENPPFAPFPKVLVGRGATNSKGPNQVMLNTLRAIKAVTGTLPVNLVVVAEGDEERMSIGLDKFVTENPERFEEVEVMWRGGRQSFSGRGSVGGGGSEGCVNFELTTSGARWGRGPVYGDIHGGRKRAVDSPAWRHIQMLESLVDETGNLATIDGFYDNKIPLTETQEANLRAAADNINLEAVARNMGVARFMTNDPFEYLRMSQYGMSWNMDGVFGGNMYGGGAGAILPSRITSKHHIRYMPNQDGIDLADKVRAQLDRNGYEDVEMKIIGDVPWRIATLEGDLPPAQLRALEIFNIPHNVPKELEDLAGGFWPAYLFGRNPLDVPISGGGAGHGGNAHANNEYFVIEGSGQVYGMAGASKVQATVLYNFAGMN